MLIFGNEVAGAGDVNGNGFGDFIIGSSGANFAFVYDGAAGDLLYWKRGSNTFF